jgi:hypothetical protein
MSPRPHEGPAEEGLSSSLLQIVHDPEHVERLRTALSGLCHRYRNSLNGIELSLYLCRREARGALPACWGDLETMYHQIVHLFDHLQTIYRPMALTMVRSTVDELIHQLVPKWRSWFESRDLALQLGPPDSAIPADFDPAQLGIGLDAMAAWRAEACTPGTMTRIAWTARGGSIELCWEEVVAPDPPDSFEDIGAPDPPVERSARRRVDLLELPLLARIIAEHGGRLHRTRRKPLRLLLRWPQFRPADIECNA